MTRISYNAIGLGTIEQADSLMEGQHIFRPELECIAVLIHYLGYSIEKKDLVLKMIQCDFHLDAIEKVKAFTENQYTGFLQCIRLTYLNPEHSDYVGQALVEDFKDHCISCKE